MNRRVRIAVSVFFAVLTVLLCILWVRSYRQVDRLSYVYRSHLGLSVASVGGALQWNAVQSKDVLVYGSNYSSAAIPENYRHRPTFDWYSRPGLLPTSSVRLPHWLFVICCVALATAPWIPIRFSLRTMLIATTLLAVLLGVITWLAL